MTVETNITVVGVKAALKEINRVNPALRRQITKDYKAVVKPAIEKIGGSVPSLPPVSGMAQPWSPGTNRRGNRRTIEPWNKGEFAKSVTAKINTRRPMPKIVGNEVSAAFRIVVRDGWALAVDMSGRKASGQTPQGRVLIAVLRGRYGDASRFVWPSWFQAFPEVEQNMVKLVERIMSEVNQKLQRA